MSSLRNAAKSHQKPHRERHQPSARQGMGLLEKKKDYRLRAKDYNQKKETIKRLRQKALDKNPDEFYHHMINSQLVDGVHREKEKGEELTPEQLALMQNRDLTYVVHKRTMEKKKILRLQSQLHLLDAEDKPQNTHTFFVDSDKEKKNFDLAKRLNTHPKLLDRAYNRPKMDKLQDGNLVNDLDPSVLKRRSKAYKELQQRIERERQLGVVQEKMEVRRAIQAAKGKTKPVKVVKAETKESAAVMMWPMERKR